MAEELAPLSLALEHTTVELPAEYTDLRLSLAYAHILQVWLYAVSCFWIVGLACAQRVCTAYVLALCFMFCRRAWCINDAL
jgi:hypothetical protein